MRRLALLPLLMFAIACNDSTPVQPDDLTIAAAARATRTLYDFTALDDGGALGDIQITPSGVLHHDGFDFGYVVEGELVGYWHVYGKAKVNLNNGNGNGSGPMLLELTEPGVGTWECRWHSEISDFNTELVQAGKFYSCDGTGDFEGMQMKGTFTNESEPGGHIFFGTAEIW